mgnify:CR=1 FL=1
MSVISDLVKSATGATGDSLIPTVTVKHEITDRSISGIKSVVVYVFVGLLIFTLVNKYLK